VVRNGGRPAAGPQHPAAHERAGKLQSQRIILGGRLVVGTAGKLSLFAKVSGKDGHFCALRRLRSPGEGVSASQSPPLSAAWFLLSHPGAIPAGQGS